MRDWWRDLWTGRKAGRRPSACTLESEGVMILACIYFSSYDVLLLLCVSVLPWAKQKSVLAGRNSICPAREDVDGGCDPEAQKSESRQSLRSTLPGLRPGRRDPGSPAPHTRPVVARSELPCCCHAQLMPCEVLAQMCEECDVEMFMVLPRRNSHSVSRRKHTPSWPKGWHGLDTWTSECLRAQALNGARKKLSVSPGRVSSPVSSRAFCLTGAGQSFR